MSGFPPPPNQQFPPPPGQGQFPPPPGAPAPAQAGQHSGFPPPPNMSAPSPPGSFAPPPPAGQEKQLSSAMGNMSIQGQGGPPPPGQGGAPKPAMFAPPPAPGQGFAPPPPNQQQPGPPGGGGPAMFQPPPAPGAAAPGAPTMFQPPPAPGQGGGPSQMHQPPPPGGQPQGQLQPGAAPSPFYQQAPSQPQMQRVAQSAPGAPPAQAKPQQLFQEQIDLKIQIPDRLCRFTTNKIPQTTSMANGCKVPVGGVIRPLAPAVSEEEDVDVVQPGNAGIIRCKRCRTYINAFVTWLENGRRWRCNICAMLNECPSTFFCHLDEQGMRQDRFQRPELSKGVVEFIAPAEYMVRPPQEPTYFFVIDVSATAVRSGMLQSTANAIRASLDELPGRGRTKIGFITFDNSVHYYNLAADLSAPQMMVVSDLKELFVPLPDNLLVNLQESRGVVEAFLDHLPEMFSKNPVVSHSCLGPALKAAFTVMKQIGGKMCVFQSIQPNMGDGALKPRENQSLMGTPNETKLLRPDIAWYKETAIEFSRQQISVDMFLFPYQYMDLAALSELPRYTAGTMHSYVSFNKEKDGPSFESQLHKTLTQKLVFESVMRIRCTQGMRIANFYGNFFIRGTDLLALPNCTSDSVFGFDLVHDEQNMASTIVTVQAALLYTSSEGERRIRVMTQAIPITSLTSELIAGVDTEAVCNLMSKQALDLGVKVGLNNSRMRLQQTCVDIVRAAKGGDKRTVSGYAVPPSNAPQAAGDDGEKEIPDNLKLLPLYTLAMMKNVAFRGGTDVHPDERIQAQYALNSMFTTACRDFIYPRMFAIHDMDASVGLPTEETPDDKDAKVAGREKILLPQVVNLSIDRLASDGIFLVDNGVQMSLWVGRSADPGLLISLFGVDSLENVDMNQVSVLTSGDDIARRFGAVVNALREDDADDFVITPKVTIVREGDAHMEARFFWQLIEDRASFQGGTHSYEEFMQFVNNPGGPGGAPPPPGPGQGMPGRGPAPPGPPGPMPPQAPGQPMGGGMPPPPPQQMGQPLMPGPPPPGQPPMPGPPPPAHSMPPGQPGGPPRGPPVPAQMGGPPQGMPPPQGPPSGSYPQPQGPPSGSYPQPQGPPSGSYPQPQGPPSGSYQPQGPPHQAPPPGNMPPPPMGQGQAPPQQPPPPMGNYGAPASAPPPQANYGQPPQRQQYGNMPPPPPAAGHGGMPPPPPPPGQHR